MAKNQNFNVIQGNINGVRSHNEDLRTLYVVHTPYLFACGTKLWEPKHTECLIIVGKNLEPTIFAQYQEPHRQRCGKSCFVCGPPPSASLLELK